MLVALSREIKKGQGHGIHRPAIVYSVGAATAVVVRGEKASS
jgi:hypothetical protein